jgi:hypothetical protein
MLERRYAGATGLRRVSKQKGAAQWLENQQAVK